MRQKKRGIRLRIDWALADKGDPSYSDASARRQPLAPPALAPASDRSRPTLLAPARQLSARITSAGPIGS